MDFVVEGLKKLPDFGLTVVYADGWESRGFAGQRLKGVFAVVDHHTATGRVAFDYSDAPTLSLCINGRTDLPGPLCQIVLGRTGIVYVIASGVGNHAGFGRAMLGIPQDMGNHYTIGIEAESSGVAPWDWTEDQLRVFPFLNKALLEIFEINGLVAHKEISTTGKIDIAGWPGDMDGMRAQVDAISFNAAKEEDDMFTEEDRKLLEEARHRVMGGIPDQPARSKTKLLDSADGGFIVARIEANIAITQGLVGAINALQNGEKFDEGKLLQSIEDRVAKAMAENAVAINVSLTKENAGK